MVERPHLIAFAGIPFAGKTTVANEVSRMKGIPIVSEDTVAFEMGVNYADGSLTHEVFAVIQQETRDRAQRILSTGQTCIYDAGLITKERRDLLRSSAKAVGADCITIFVNTPEEKARLRWERNKKTQEKFDIDEELFTWILANFEPPREGEEYIVFQAGDNISEWIADNNI